MMPNDAAKTMEFEVPWLEGNTITLTGSRAGQMEIVHVMPRSSRRVCIVNGASIIWETQDQGPGKTGGRDDVGSWTLLTPSEKLCLSVMPSSYGSRPDFPGILNHAFWQKVMAAADVAETMSL